MSSAKWILEAYTREHVTASEGMGMEVGKTLRWQMTRVPHVRRKY